MLLYILIQIFLISFCLSEYIFINYNPNQKGMYTFQLSLGNLFFPFQIDMHNNISFVTNQDFLLNETNSLMKKYEICPCQFNKQIIESCILYSDKMILHYNNYQAKNFSNFYFYFLKGINIEQSMSFTLNVQNQFSITHQLYERKIINKKSFGLVKTEFDSGLIYFGEIDKKYIKKKKIKKCNIPTGNIYWGCSLSIVTFGKDIYNNKDRAIFHSNRKEILAPKNFISFLKKSYFNDFYEKEMCQNLNKKERVMIECICSIIRNLPNLEFIFEEDIVIKIKSEDLFYYQGSDHCIFIIEENKNGFDEEFQRWEFGMYFIQRNPLLFSYEDFSITFYLDDPKVTLQSTNLKKYSFYLNIFTLAFGILILFLEGRKLPL